MTRAFTAAVALVMSVLLITSVPVGTVGAVDSGTLTFESQLDLGGNHQAWDKDPEEDIGAHLGVNDEVTILRFSDQTKVCRASTDAKGVQNAVAFDHEREIAYVIDEDRDAAIEKILDEGDLSCKRTDVWADFGSSCVCGPIEADPATGKVFAYNNSNITRITTDGLFEAVEEVPFGNPPDSEMQLDGRFIGLGVPDGSQRGVGLYTTDLGTVWENTSVGFHEITLQGDRLYGLNRTTDKVFAFDNTGDVRWTHEFSDPINASDIMVWDEQDRVYVMHEKPQDEANTERNNVTSFFTSNGTKAVQWLNETGDDELDGMALGQTGRSVLFGFGGAAGSGFTEFYSTDTVTAPLDVQGFVVDVNGTGISNASVELINTSTDTVTDTDTAAADGEYNFSNVEFGEYRVRANAQNFAPNATENFTVDQDITDKNVTLRKPRLFGTVTEEGTADPIEGATVTVFNNSSKTEKLASDTTDEEGEYGIGVRDGDHFAQANAPGFLASSRNITVNGSTEENFILTPNPRELELRLHRFIPPGEDKGYTVFYRNASGEFDVSDHPNTSVVSNNTSVVVINESTNRAFGLPGVNDTTEVTATFVNVSGSSFNDTVNVTVAQLTVENLPILPPSFRVSAAALDGNIQWLFMAIIIAIVVRMFSENAYMTTASYVAVVGFGWGMAGVETGIFALTVLYGLFALLVLTQLPSSGSGDSLR